MYFGADMPRPQISRPQVSQKSSLNLTPGDGSSWEERGNLTWSHQDVSEYLSFYFPRFFCVDLMPDIYWFFIFISDLLLGI